jgi:hypothetical protein
MVGKGVLSNPGLPHTSLEDRHVLTPVWNITDVWSQLCQRHQMFSSLPEHAKTDLDVAKNLPLGENCKWRTNA